jgi:hypothetical protein
MELGEVGHWDSGKSWRWFLVLIAAGARGAVGRRILAKMVLGMRARMGLVECLAKGCRARQRYSWVKDGCWRSGCEQE